MDHTELDLYGRAAEQMAAALRAAQERKPGSVQRRRGIVPIPAPYYYHYHESTGEECSDILSRLGILLPVTDEPVECCFTFAMEQGRVYQHAVARAANGPTLAELLAAFLSRVHHYRGEFTSYQDRPFPVPEHLDPLFKSLVAGGYAQRGTGEREYRWTEKIAPIMLAAELWLPEEDFE